MKHIKEMKKIITVLFCAFFALGLNAQQKKLKLYQLADSLGTGLGLSDWIGDYSVTADTAYIQPPVGDDYVINRLIVSIEDNANFTAEGYGALSVLTNGIKIRVANDNGELFVITPFNIKSNGDWGASCYDISYESFGAGDNVMNVRWTFSNAGHPIHLDNRDGSNPRLEIILNDNFTGLIHHRFFLQGFVDDETY